VEIVKHHNALICVLFYWGTHIYI